MMSVDPQQPEPLDYHDLAVVRIAIISAEPRLNQQLASALSAKAMTVDVFESVAAAIAAPASADIVVLDVGDWSLNGLRRLRQHLPTARFLVLGSSDARNAIEGFGAGAHAWMTRWEPLRTVESAIILLARGGVSLSLPIFQMLLHLSRIHRERDITLAATAGLSPRQIEALMLAGRGLTDREIAELLFLSVRTVNRHMSDILAALHCKSRRAAVGLVLSDLPPPVRLGRRANRAG